MRPTSIRLAVLAVVAAAAAAACSGDKVGEAVLASPAVGTYTLRTVNGIPLPASVATGSRVITFVADTLQLLLGGTYTEVLVTQSSAPGQPPAGRDAARFSGQWALNGSSIGLIPKGGGTLSGADTLTFSGTVTDTASKAIAAVTQVYRK